MHEVDGVLENKDGGGCEGTEPMPLIQTSLERNEKDNLGGGEREAGRIMIHTQFLLSRRAADALSAAALARKHQGCLQ